MRESQRQGRRKCSYDEGQRPGGLASRVLRPHVAHTALALSALVAATSVGGLWPLEQRAYAQGAEKAGAGGAAGAAGAEKAGSGGGGGGAETSGAGGAAPAAEKGGEKPAAPPAAETKVVIYVEGPKAAEIKGDIEKSLPPGVTAVPEGPFVEALKKQGLLPLAKNIKGPRERADASAKLQAAAQEAQVQAAIVASAPGAKGGKYDVAILIVPSDSPQPLASTNVKAPSKGDQKRTEAIAGVISPAISGIVPIMASAPEAAPPAEEKKEEAKAEEEKKEEPKAEEKKEEPAAAHSFTKGKYIIEGGIGTQGRSFFYIFPPGSGLSGAENVRDYDILAAPHLYLRADVFPFAGPGDSFINNIGLTAVAGGAVGLRSTLNGGGRATPETGVSTTFFHFRVGPKVRFALGAGDKAPQLTAEVAYSRWAFTFTDATGASPSFIYQSIRPGVGLRLPAGPVAILAEGGFHVVTSAGELDRRFPNASTLGFDLQAGLGVPLSELFEARFNINYNRYRSNLKADLNSPTGYVAAGAVDQFFGLQVGVAVAP